MEKIKVVYSWIGPKGPVWNTEVPNVLALAAVTEGVNQVDSHKFWADDSWMRLFEFQKDQYEIYPAIGIDVDDNRPFVIPFTLAWRIMFEHYFCGNTGLLEFAHTPWHLVKLIRQNNGYILINHGVEAYVQHGHIQALHGYFRGIHGLPLNKIIYMTGCVNAKELYEDYCVQHGIPNVPEERLTVIPYASSFDIFRPNTYRDEDEPQYDTETVPEKLFLMWNRRFRPQRIEMALHLEKNNLIDRSLISFSEYDLEMPTIRLTQRIDPYIGVTYPGITNEVINRFSSRLPLVLDDETNVNQMCQDNENKTRPYYQRSLVSIITETNYRENEVSLTEKSFKPLKEKHPFIIVGVPGALKGMHDLGLKTFSEFWNESYDDITDPVQRMNRISDITLQIGSWTPEQIIDFRRRVKPILDHNYNVLRNAGPRNVVEKITNLIRNGQI